ncbi:MAG: hypothetical protein H6838_00730 [Planctomycetes bacterium]|nr:hypothetical protein [Planctomycetota bacterium]MCB9883979.1 hypothetical protein [Planctomycetota bacterium]
MTTTIVRWVSALSLGAALLGQAAPPAPAAPIDPVPVLDRSTFATHWRHVLPSADELQWREIPWLGTLGEAVVQAHAQDKPVLLWAMNGHPLACT